MKLSNHLPLIVVQVKPVEVDHPLLVELQHLADVVQRLAQDDRPFEDLHHRVPSRFDRSDEHVARNGGLLLARAVAELLADARAKPDPLGQLGDLVRKVLQGQRIANKRWGLMS